MVGGGWAMTGVVSLQVHLPPVGVGRIDQMVKEIDLPFRHPIWVLVVGPPLLHWRNVRGEHLP